MLRKLWLGSLFLALTGTTIGLAYSETPINNEIQKPKDRFLTVNEKGKAPIKCKLILAWTNKTGQQCYLVQSVETGAKITIVQNPASSKEQNSTTNYHWANATTPPASSPIPPEYNIVKTTPLHKEPVKIEAKTAVNNSTVVPMQTAIQKNNAPLKIETATIKKRLILQLENPWRQNSSPFLHQAQIKSLSFQRKAKSYLLPKPLNPAPTK